MALGAGDFFQNFVSRSTQAEGPVAACAGQAKTLPLPEHLQVVEAWRILSFLCRGKIVYNR
jgi:hypothetical protein